MTVARTITRAGDGAPLHLAFDAIGEAAGIAIASAADAAATLHGPASRCGR